jgi:hypothetical protein
MADEILKHYEEREPSLECHLDGRYFNLVLADYMDSLSDQVSVVERPVILDITTHPRVETRNNWEEKLEIRMNPHDTEPIQLKLKPDIIELLRVIIEIYDVDAENPRARHSNLLIVDNLEKKVLRFEPLEGNPYDLLINTFMTDYIKQALPGYSFMELKLHPQILSIRGRCKNEGMCVAYVTKLAALIATGRPIHFSPNPVEADRDVKKFAAEVEAYFEGENLEGEEDIEFAVSQGERTIIGGGLGGIAGGLLFGPAGLAVGAISGGLIGHYTYKGKK